MPFYNCHIHIFSAQCAPKRFLQVGLPGWLDWAAGGIKGGLETRTGRFLVGLFSKARVPFIKVASRYASFASIGTNSSQQMVFENILNFYPAGTRFVALTLNMDYMGAGPSELKYQGQIDQVIRLRSLYPDILLPFLCVDPRMGTKEELTAFVQKYIGGTVLQDGRKASKPFIGVKLYPSLGFFPYDARLEGVYEYCETNGIPIMTHCTPSGAFFLGKITPLMSMPQPIAVAGSPAPVAPAFGGKNNDKDCDNFLLPSNWDSILIKFPKLKVCLAHMGGTSEMWPKTPDLSRANWYQEVKRLISTHANVYTDISYTLSDEKADYRTWKEIESLLGQDAYANRILFGTDYFMTEQEDAEEYLAQKFINWLSKRNRIDYVRLLTEKNPAEYLGSSFYTP